MKTSETIKAIAPALLAAQKQIGAAVKDAANPFFKSKYADLEAVIEAVKGPLNENGISFLQAVDSDNGSAHIETVLLHESGEFVSSSTPVYCKEPNNPQALGSGITYAKRYGLQAILGLPTTEDDGNAAAKPREQPKPNPNRPAITKAEINDPKRIAWILTCGSAVEAKKKLASKYTWDVAVDAFIDELFTEAA